MSQVLFLTGEEVRDLASMSEYVDAVRDGYRQRGEGAPAVSPTRLLSSDPFGMLTSYTAVLPDTGVMGGYVYAGGFASRDAWFMTPLFDADTGEPLALVDGASMSAMKTGAAGGVSVDELAHEDASRMAVFGSGPNARTQLLAAAAVRDVTEVAVYSPTRSHREAFAAHLDGELDADVEAVESSEDAVVGADVVVTATDSPSPVFDGDLLEPGTHVSAIGQYGKTVREIDVTTVARSKYVPDLRERAFGDAGAFIRALDEGVVSDAHVHAELGEIVAGKVPGRESDDDITVYDNGATAIETVAAAHMLYERAKERGRGSTFELQAKSRSVWHPDDH
jgi:alanine dehydrogenase